MMTTIGKLFNIVYGQKEYHNKEWLEGDDGENILISSKGVDNGVYGFFNIDNKFKAPVITVQGYGTIGQAFVQEYDCSVDDHMLILTPKEKMSMEELFQVAYQIRLTKWKYKYGRGITPKRIENQRINLIKSKNDYQKLSKDLMPEDKNNIKIKKPQRIKLVNITDLCNIERKYAEYLNQIDLSVEKIPYITTTEYDNGISLFCNEKPNFKKGSLTISLDGSCGVAFYQFNDFMAGEKTAVLTLKGKPNPLLLMYVGTIIRRKSWKYHYGRKLSIGRLIEFEIPMPIDNKGNYDLEYIEELMENSYGFKELKKYL